MPPEIIVILVVVALFLVSTTVFILTRFKRCPPGKIMIVYGKTGRNSDGTPRCVTCFYGGLQYIWPLVQSYKFMDLAPIPLSIDLQNALSRTKERVNVICSINVGISTEPKVMQNAAERLSALSTEEIGVIAKDIFTGQLRLVISATEIEYIDDDRDKFLEGLYRNTETEFKKIGLRLINVNIDDIISAERP